uniref:Uncharacterized protein n=1 Tax=Salmonella sp. TaxID=599 RepID=A0A482ETI4_SALSP|nr:hypothetical protein NNIBIDOC_00100 [Salmonella sp.]
MSRKETRASKKCCRGIIRQIIARELPPADIPDRVSRWMKYFRAPWEAFWCYDHREDGVMNSSSFPTFAEGNTCPQCRDSI